jgi:hypothetical protein
MKWSPRAFRIDPRDYEPDCVRNSRCSCAVRRGKLEKGTFDTSDWIWIAGFTVSFIVLTK